MPSGLLAAALTIGVLGRAAEAGDLPSPLELRDVIDAVRARNPSLAARRKQFEAGLLRPRAVSQPDDPMLMLEWWQQPVNFSSVPIMLTLKQPIPWRGKLKLQRELAEREARVLGDQSSETERLVEAEARRAYFDLALAERSLAINQMVHALLDNLVKITDSEYRVGRAVQADVLRAQAELLDNENDGLDLARDRDGAIARLNGLLDRPADASLGPTATQAVVISLPSEAELLARALDHRPEVLRARNELAAAESRVALARRENYPELAVWGAFMVDFRGVDTFTAGVSTTLPVFSTTRKRALTSAGDLDVQAARRTLDALRRQTDVELRTALLELQAAARHVRFHHEKMIPLAELTLASAQSSYQTGRVPFMTVIEAARMVRDHHLSHLKFQIEFEKRLADLEQIVGEDVRGGER
jgi:outer membrane protein TolC